MASIITGITVPDNTDPRGQNIIQSANTTRDSGDPNSADVVRSKPPTTNQNPQQFSLGDTGVPAIQNTQPFFLGGAETVALSKEDVSKMVVDAIRNTSINGVYPTVTGGSIDFSLPTSTASEQWSQQNWSVIDSNFQIANSKNASLGSSAQGVNSGNLSLMGSNLQIANSRNAPLDGNTQIANSKVAPSIESNAQIANSKVAPSVENNSQIANSKVAPSVESNSQIANSRSVPAIASNSQIANASSAPLIASNSQIANARSTPLIDSNSQVANARSVPLIASNSQIANARSAPLIDSNARVANSRSSPLTDSDRRVANPQSNTLSRRRSNEQALDVNGVTPLYVKSADGKSAMVVYIQDSHTISIDPDTSIGDTIKDSMSKADIGPSEYFLSGTGGSDQFPFKITVKSGDNPTYKVSYNSSIINGTNGGPFNIVGLNLDKGITEEKFIIAEANVTSNPFEITNAGFTIKEVGPNETDEVVLEGGKQTKLRLLIGKITVEPQGSGKLLRPWQAITTSYRTAASFENGIAAYILEAAPTHQSRI
jgi:hypothetical protein